ncbi:MAG: glutaredoxin family protein [Gammaproteobacteria bacterium]
MKIIPAILIPLLLGAAGTVTAVTIVECEDSQGERTFQASCPPGTTQVNARDIRTGTSPESGEDVSISATLYVVPDCDPCETVREFLQMRNITVTVKDASTEQAVQEELQALVGTLRAPVTVIGDNIISGFSRSELTAALTAAGYVEPE